MSKETFRLLVIELVKKRFLPQECLGASFESLYDLCGGLPREVESFTRSCCNLESLSWDKIKSRYLRCREEFYRNRIRSLLGKDIADELKSGSVEFACRYFVGERMQAVPEIWHDCGMIIQIDNNCRLPCLAAEKAMLSVLNKDQILMAIEIFRGIDGVRWKALELAVVWAARCSIQMSIPMVMYCTDLCSKNKTELRIVIKNIQRHEVRPAIDGIPQSTLFICPDRQPVIDFFIHDDSGKHYFLQVSESPYIDHSSKYTDMSTDTVLDRYRSLAHGSHQAEYKYIYLTTSTDLMRVNKSKQPISKYFHPNVWLVSNATGDASKFLHGLL